MFMYKLLHLFPDTNAIFQFLDEDATAIVPISKLKEQEHKGLCIVTWTEVEEGVQRPFFMLHTIIIVTNYSCFIYTCPSSMKLYRISTC